MTEEKRLMQKMENAIALERWFLRYPAFVWFASFLHISWGLILLVENQQIHCVPLEGLYKNIPTPIFLGLTLIAVGVVALWSPPEGTDIVVFKILTLLPQQYFTLMTGGSALRAIGTGIYADGIVRPRSFIFADQLPAVLASIFHTVAILSFIYLGSKGRI